MNEDGPTLWHVLLALSLPSYLLGVGVGVLLASLTGLSTAGAIFICVVTSIAALLMTGFAMASNVWYEEES